MYIDTQVVEAATARLDRAHGTRLGRGPAGAARPQLSPEREARVLSYAADRRNPTDTAALERAIGDNDLLSLNYLWCGIRAARSVGRIVIPPIAGDPGGAATGFLIGPNLLMTNHHVFSAPEIAQRARVQFGYEIDSHGNERVPTWFNFTPGRFFVASETLDYCIVSVDPATKQGPEGLKSFGWLRLNPRLGKTDYGQYLSIIQHPGGQTKQIAIRENRLLPFTDADDFLSYESDTFRGSSGSPVLNDFWDLVALHHSGKPFKDKQGRYIGHDGRPIVDHKPQEDEIQWIANEGARVSRIIANFQKSAPQGEERDVLEKTFLGELKPDPIPLEIGPANGRQDSTEPVVYGGPSLAAPNARSFLVVLPLDVSLHVESPRQPATIPSATAKATTSPVRDARDILFEKLNFDSDYSDRRGYDDRFLGHDRRVNMPTIDDGHSADIAPTKHGGKVLHYHHFSIVTHANRRMPVLSAGNVDYRAAKRDERARDEFGKDEWIIDDRLDDKYQIPRGFYDRWKRLDYGHLVRRDDNCWGGSADEIEFSNADTFHLTNCTPQHEAFNRDRFGYHGLWGRLENLISTQAQRDGTIGRLCVFAGPIFNNTKDLLCRDDTGNIRIPISFWKVIVAPTRRGGLRAYGFVTGQEENLDDDPPFEDFQPAAMKDEQASLAAIERKTIVRFSDDLKSLDIMLNHPDGNELAVLESATDIWLGLL
jgi:endonuclease G, mitochondrial